MYFGASAFSGYTPSFKSLALSLKAWKLSSSCASVLIRRFSPRRYVEPSGFGLTICQYRMAESKLVSLIQTVCKSSRLWRSLSVPQVSGQPCSPKQACKKPKRFVETNALQQRNDLVFRSGWLRTLQNLAHFGLDLFRPGAVHTPACCPGCGTRLRAGNASQRRNTSPVRRYC